MRKLVWTILTIGMISAVTPAKAQTYDPNFPVCLQLYGRAGNYISCSYTSIPQCRISASGRAAQCIVNPYFAGPYRRPRHAYRYY
jgi:Protein of unknown function (DUF3551)